MRRTHIQSAIVVAIVVATAATCSRSQPVNRSQQPPAVGKSESNPKAFLYTLQSVPVETLNPTGPDIEQTPSGVATKVIKRGTGTRHPTSDDGIVLYSQIYDETGQVNARWDGFVGDPAKEETRVGWEMLQMMVEGEVRRVWLPDPKSPHGVKVADYELTWITPRPPEESAKPPAERTSTE